MKRTHLSARKLPTYSKGEEIMNTTTHIVGGGIGVLALVSCVLRATANGSSTGILCAVIYGCSMILLYTISSVYHGLRPGAGKKVLQILEECKGTQFDTEIVDAFIKTLEKK